MVEGKSGRIGLVGGFTGGVSKSCLCLSMTADLLPSVRGLTRLFRGILRSRAVLGRKLGSVLVLVGRMGLGRCKVVASGFD